MFRVRKLAAMVAGLVLGATVLAACSSSSPSATSSTAATTGSGSSPALTALTTQVSKWLEQPTSINITTPVSGTIPKGKTIYWLPCSLPACLVQKPIFEAATAALGWHLKIILAGETPETIGDAWTQAVQDHPDAVVTSGFSRTLFEPELQELKAMHVPVFDFATADPPGNGLTAVFDYGPDYYASGQRLAAYALSQSGDKNVHALDVISSIYQNLTDIANGFDAELKAKCSSGCSTARLNVPVTSIGSNLPTLVTSYLQVHPGINWSYVGFSDMVLGLPAALNAAGFGDVKLLTIDNDPSIDNYIRNGQSLVATDGFPIYDIIYRIMDYLARTYTGNSTAVDTAHTLPIWILDKNNMLPASQTAGPFSLVTDTAAQFEHLWHG
jgi:ribose transport system substrate-binding protein